MYQIKARECLSSVDDSLIKYNISHQRPEVSPLRHYSSRIVQGLVHKSAGMLAETCDGMPNVEGNLPDNFDFQLLFVV